MKCVFDGSLADDTADFETGNNAEVTVAVPLCAACFEKLEENENLFLEQNSAAILAYYEARFPY